METQGVIIMRNGMVKNLISALRQARPLLPHPITARWADYCDLVGP